MKMRAVILQEAGGVENMTIAEVERPNINETQVLVETRALSVNPVDYKVRGNEDILTAIYGTQRPAILGWDIAGTVVQAGSQVTTFKTGDRVFGMVNFVGAGKGYAEYVAVSEHHLAKMPENISFTDAAASTLAALTALQVLNTKIKKDDRVLIHAGSGGVGHFAIQIAKSMGAYVISTSSAKNREFIMSLGADEHIDYREYKFEEVLSDLDFVFDMFNGEVLLSSVNVVKPGGMIVSIPTPEFTDEVQALAKEKDIELAFHMVLSNGDDMKTIARLLESGAVKAHVSKIFSLNEMAQAHEHLESGRTVGKVAISI